MIIECFTCESKVDASIIADAPIPDDPSACDQRAVFLLCPVCKNPMVGIQEEYPVSPDFERFEWGAPERVWPEPEKPLSFNLPTIVRICLAEARRCYKAGAYRACAVMSGAALEGICLQFASKKSIAHGLKDLLEKKIIDERLS